MSIESELQNLITNEILGDKSGEHVATDEPLMSSGKVDSMGLLQIITFLQEKYSVDVLASGGPEDFETVDALAAAVRRGQQQD